MPEPLDASPVPFVLSATAAARAMGVVPGRVRKAVRNGELDGFELGGHLAVATIPLAERLGVPPAQLVAAARPEQPPGIAAFSDDDPYLNADGFLVHPDSCPCGDHHQVAAAS
ncbi:hypothetical protein ACMATS_05975 [Streptoverticillium reticulum]|uniref:hypothetical protein n=1 Tax=Streptoverticillium reticulum TaxID=1433415 RepID=UPI0039BFA285